MELAGLIVQRGFYYWVDEDGDIVSPAFSSTDEAWQWADDHEDY